MTATTTGINTIVVPTGLLTAAAVFAGANANDVVSVANGSNLAAATIGADFVDLTIATGGTVTMTNAQHTAFSGTITAAGTERIIISDDAQTLTAKGNIEAYTLAAGANNITVLAATNVTAAGAGVDTITVTAALVAAGTYTSLTTNDVIKLTGTTGNIAGVNGGAVTGAGILDLTTANQIINATMTAVQYNGFQATGVTGITAAATNDTITLTTAGTVTADADILTYSIIGGSSITLVAAAQNVTRSSAGASTINIGTLSSTGTFTTLGAGDTIIMGTGSSIAGATLGGGAAGNALGNTIVNITGSVTMTEVQHDALIAASPTASIIATGATDQITIADGDLASIDLDADIETYVLGEDSTTNAITVTLAAGNQSATQTDNAGTDDAITFAVGGLTLTAASILTAAGTGADVLSATTGANIAAAAITGVPTLSLTSGASITLSQAQHEIFQAATTVAAGVNTLTIVGAGTITAEGVIENYVLANGTNAFTFTASTAQGVTGGTGADTVNVTLANLGASATTASLGTDAVTDRVSITNTAQDAGTAKITVTGFTAGTGGDQIRVIDTAVSAGVSQSNVNYAVVAASSNTAYAGTAGATIEIESTNVADFTAIADAGAIEVAILAALGQTTVGTYTVVLYSGADAGIYEMLVGTNAMTAASDITIELVGVLSNVGANALTVANFY